MNINVQSIKQTKEYGRKVVELVNIYRYYALRDLRWEESDLGSRQNRIMILALLLAMSWVALGTVFNPSEPLFSHVCRMGIIIAKGFPPVVVRR